ncbi:MAG: CHRD domain-containing protein [Wenzhouxiangellaceae bacterium]
MFKAKCVGGAIALLFSGACLAQVFVGELDGPSEVPGPGDPDGTGQGAAWIIDGSIHFDILVQDVTLPLTLAHIHDGDADEAGPVVVDFTPFINGNSIRGVVPIDDALASSIAADPGGFYFNVHNDDFPGGAVRGQLQSQATTRLQAELLAENEVPTPGPAGGNGFADVRLGGFAAAFDFSADGIEIPPILDHIHQGPAGVNGPVVVDFDPVTWTGGPSSGEARGIVLADPGVIADVIANPQGHYVNIHTNNFPGGAIRGQLSSPPTGAAVSIPVNAGWALLLMVLALIAAGIVAFRR